MLKQSKEHEGTQNMSKYAKRRMQFMAETVSNICERNLDVEY